MDALERANRIRTARAQLKRDLKAGKVTIHQLLREHVPELALSVSATTRPPRLGEENGVDYHFLTDEEFADKVAAGDFVEWAKYSGRRYGTLRSELKRHLEAGRPVVLEIEVQG